MIVMGSEMAVRTMVKMPILIPPASGTLYVPFGPRVEDPPTKMMDAIDTSVTKINMGYEPVVSPRLNRHTSHDETKALWIVLSPL